MTSPALRIICDYAFLFIQLKSFVVPDGVIAIGKRAFSQNMALESIELPNSLIQIGEDVFEGNLNLSTIYIPKGTKKKYERLLPKHKDLLIECK